MNISSFAQETMCFVGQNLVFEEASKLVNSLTGSNFNAKQVERVCHQYGGILEQENQDRIQKMEFKEYSKSDSQDLHYVMFDGAMYPTREKEQPWKETKLGRIFKKSAILPFCKTQNFIENSTYVAHLGSIDGFFPRLEYEIENLKNVVFICDGAKWIWNWVQDNYPEHTQILDYFHAKEHLCDFAKDYFKDEKLRNQWIDNQEINWLEQEPEMVIKAIEELKPNNKTNQKKRNLLNYYTTHLERMRYKKFREKGYNIGSGAVESAHKSVLQERLKLSGQHWSLEGLQQMTQLRVVYKSNNWHKIIELAKNAA